MKFLFSLCSVVCFLMHVTAQTIGGGISSGISIRETDTTSIKNLNDSALRYLFINTDSSIHYAQEAFLLSRRTNSLKSEADADYLFAGNYWIMGDYTRALNSALEALRIYETLNDREDISNAYRAMASIYRDQGDFDHAILYAHKCRELAEKIYPAVIYTIIGSIYEKFNHFDSALYYMNKANEKDIAEHGKSDYGYISYILGNIYARVPDYPIATGFYRKAIAITENQKIYKDLMEMYNGMARLYKNTGRLDSSIVYAEKTLAVGKSTPFLLGMLEASSLLTEIYSSRKNPDSTIKYMGLRSSIKDTLYSQERSRQFQNLVFKEQVHQQEIEEERLRMAEERRQNLQLAGIATFIPVFFGFILLLSRRKVRPWVVEFLGILGLLLLFEFISLLLHPYLERWTHQTPVFLILILTAIAAGLAPLHHRLESWVKIKLAHRETAKHEKSVPAETPKEGTE